jgi:hypothetical protein
MPPERIHNRNHCWVPSSRTCWAAQLVHSQLLLPVTLGSHPRRSCTSSRQLPALCMGTLRDSSRQPRLCWCSWRETYCSCTDCQSSSRHIAGRARSLPHTGRVLQLREVWLGWQQPLGIHLAALYPLALLLASPHWQLLSLLLGVLGRLLGPPLAVWDLLLLVRGLSCCQALQFRCLRLPRLARGLRSSTQHQHAYGEHGVYFLCQPGVVHS